MKLAHRSCPLACARHGPRPRTRQTGRYTDATLSIAIRKRTSRAGGSETRRLSETHEVIHALGLKPGEVVGRYRRRLGLLYFHLARHVGEKGRIYAVDVSADMILHVNRRIREAKQTCRTVLAEPDDPLLPYQS